MLAYFNVAIGWKELIKRTAKDTVRDDALGLAAQLAFYFFLALFPALLCLVALASLFPLENFTDHVARMIEPFAPSAVVDIIRQQMLQIAAGNNGGLIGIGLLGAIWSSSAAVVAIVNAMNRAYDIEETRPWWKVRGTAILLTIGLAFFIMISFTLVVAGPQIADALTSRLGISELFAWTWKVLQWPLVFMLVATAISLIYHFAPDADQDWVWITPGSLVATVLWLAGSVGFRFYVVNFGSYEQTYGTIGGIILALMWFYLSGLAIVIGAELNAEIEHASPWGKELGGNAPGQRRTIGAAAARLYRKISP